MSPSQLRNQFALLSLLSATLILVLAGLGIFHIYNKEMMRVAEETATYVGNSIFEQERHTLLKINGNSEKIDLAASEFNGFDSRMKTFLRTFNMHKIKVFSAGKAIVYSTDHKIIGMAEDHNPKLVEVLASGMTLSDLGTKDRILDLKGEERLHVDVVESYIPIRGGAGGSTDPIIGAFEVYVDVSSMRHRVTTAVNATLMVLGTILVLVFTLLFLIMRRGMTELRRVQNQLHQFASIDFLTGAFNRRQVLLRLQEEQARLRRDSSRGERGCVSLLLMDIDNFKQVNDTHGHACGDQVLQEVCARIKNGLRNYDVLGRYGGEEFLVILPGTCLQDATLQAERLRKTVSERPITCERGNLDITLSIGVAAIDPPDEEITQTIRRADLGLYHAKSSGRNQVCTPEREALQ